MSDITAFLASVGVNTHLDAVDTGYGDVALVQASLAYLGISLIRDHAYDVDIAAYRTMAGAGTTFDLILDDDPKVELDDMAPIHASIRFLEGPNEVDFQPILTNGIADPVLAAVAEQASVAAALAATPALRGTPLLAPSLASSDSILAFAGALVDATASNLHSYAAFGASPGDVIAADLASMQALFTRAAALTETGYYTMPTDDSGVDESVQARLTLDTLFDAASLGITPIFLYELLDEGADPGNTDDQLHYGLFRADGTPKPVATALHDLTTILRAADATAGAAPALVLGTDGAPETTRTLILSGAAGVTVAAIWAEPPIWDAVAHAEIAPPETPTRITLGAVFGSVLVFDPLLGTDPIARYTEISALTLTLTDHPLLLQLSATPPATTEPVPTPSAPAIPPSIPAEPAVPVSSTANGVPASIRVHRFFDTTNGTHFYTADADEARTVQRTRPDLTDEGDGLRSIAATTADPAAAPVYRFFDTVFGTQFLTASAAERDGVIATRPDLRYEPGSLFYEHATEQPGDSPVYRFFDTVHGTHFYTDSATERAAILTERADLVDEGIGFYEPG